MVSLLVKVLGSLIFVVPALAGACYLFAKFCKPDIGNLNPMAWKGLALVQVIFYSWEIAFYGYGLKWCADNKIWLLITVALVIALFSVGIFLDQSWCIWSSGILFTLVIMSIFSYYQSLEKYELNYVLLSLIMTIFIFMAIMYFFGYLQIAYYCIIIPIAAVLISVWGYYGGKYIRIKQDIYILSYENTKEVTFLNQCKLRITNIIINLNTLAGSNNIDLEDLVDKDPNAKQKLQAIIQYTQSESSKLKEIANKIVPGLIETKGDLSLDHFGRINPTEANQKELDDALSALTKQLPDPNSLKNNIVNRKIKESVIELAKEVSKPITILSSIQNIKRNNKDIKSKKLEVALMRYFALTILVMLCITFALVIFWQKKSAISNNGWEVAMQVLGAIFCIILTFFILFSSGVFIASEKQSLTRKVLCIS